MSPTEILRAIWGHSYGLWFSFATIDRADNNRFYEQMHVRNEFDSIPPQLVGVDQYFSALTFTKERRSNDTFGGARLLFADLDHVYPEGLLLTPSLIWETSPGSWQCVWFLNELITDYEAWAELNRRMTYYVGADRGGWMGSKLLRVPGSLNFKRATPHEVPIGQIPEQYNAHATYDIDRLHVLLTHTPTVAKLLEGQSDLMPELVPFKRRNQYLQEKWNKMNLRARSMVLEPAVSDRSLHIVQTINELWNFSDVTPEEIFQIIQLQPWNKWADQPEKLWQEVLRVVS
jgi:hypothetical protein